MNINRGAILCFGYILGLLLTSLWGGFNPEPTVLQWGLILGAIALGTGVAAWLLPRRFWQLRPQFWFAVGLAALLAVGYFQLRIPRPQTGDIFSLTQQQQQLLKYPVEISGKITQQPTIKGETKQQLWLQVEQIKTNRETLPTKGKLYVTLNTKAEPLKTGYTVNLKGRLYQPKPAKNNYTFDFVDYLRERNTFLGFSATEIQIKTLKSFPSEAIRSRIIRAHSEFLPDDLASLLSSMVLDWRSANLPPDIYHLWSKAGLSHTVAASGFQVSLLLGVVLWALKKQPEKVQFTVGTGVLISYLCLAGLQPSILRATLMGIGSLTAILLDRKTKPLSTLLLAATILLIFNPLWIWNLSFQLSFLATFGLLTTLKPIEKSLDFLPPTIATAIAIPIAASLWTLPLLAYEFKVIATYAIPLGVLLTPLLAIVSLGGMFSGAVGLIVPPLGGAIAYGVGFPLQWMVKLVEWVVTLPGSNLSIAALHWSQLAIFYGVMLFIWLSKTGQKYTKSLGFSLVILFIAFLSYRHFNTTQLTILNSNQVPVVVAQAAGKTVVINSESDSFTQYNLIPFLRQSGINQVDAFIDFNATPTDLNLKLLDDAIAVKKVIDIFPAAQLSEASPLTREILPLAQTQKIGKIHLQLLQEKIHVLEIRLGLQRFYLLEKQQPTDNFITPWNQGILIADRANIDFKTWQTLKSKAAIAIGSSQGHFLAPNKIVYWTAEDGSMQWTPHSGLTSLNPDLS